MGLYATPFLDFPLFFIKKKKTVMTLTALNPQLPTVYYVPGPMLNVGQRKLKQISSAHRGS